MRVAHPPGLGKSRGFDFENRVSSSAAYSSFDLGILSVCVNLSVTPFVERASNEIENRSIQGQAQEDLPHDHELVVTQAPSCSSVDLHRLCVKYALERKIDFRKIRRSCPARCATCGRNTSSEAERSKSLTLRGEALEVGVEVLTHTSTRAPKRRTGRQKRRTGRRTG